MAFTGRLGTTDSQLGNIVLGSVGDAAVYEFLADAVLLKVASATFSADSVLSSLVLEDFTADSILTAGTTVQFTADAVVLKTASATFTVDAILVNKLIEDDFNRTTALGEVGQPQTGHYKVEPFAGEGNVNGTALVAVTDFGLFGFKYGPSNVRLFVQFDYAITEADAGGGYEFYGGNVPSGAPSTWWKSNLFVAEAAGGEWSLGTSGMDASPYDYNPTPGDMWRVKAWIDIRSGGTWAAKTWKVGDAEPVAWQVTLNDAQFGEFGSVNTDIEHVLYLTSGETESAKVDNLYIAELTGNNHQDWFFADAFLLKTVTGGLTADAVLFKTLSATFTGDAELVEATGTVTGAINADAVLAPNTLNWAFTANAVLVATTFDTITADAYLIQQGLGSFTADAWVEGVNELTFTANSIIVRTAIAGDSRLLKTITFHVQQRRPVALSAYVPPRNPEDEEQTPPTGVGDLPCLPPCPGYPGGPGSQYGANGGVIRVTIVYCDTCGVFYYTHRNKIGLGTGTSSGHAGCEASHGGSNHMARMFADYTNKPITDVSMRAKLLWSQNAPSSAGIRVFANLSEMPTMVDDGDYIPWNSDFEDNVWNAGDYLGTLSFSATDSGTVASTGEDLNWDDTASSLTIRPASLTSDYFRFEIDDSSQYYGAEFRAPNVPITIGD